MSQETCHEQGRWSSRYLVLSYTEVVMLATNTASLPLPISATARLSTALFAGAFGVFLLYFAAFAHSDVLHNGTHDTRHAIVAPCH